MKKTNEEQFTISLKMFVMNRFREIIKEVKKVNTSYESPSALILTANGLIIGDLEDYSKKPVNIEKKTIEISYLSELLNKEIENIEKEHKIINYLDSGSMINLKNVVLFPNGNMRQKINIYQMMVFVDKIISFTIMDRKKFEEDLSRQKS